MDAADSSNNKPILDPSHELPMPHDMELTPPHDMELPRPHDMQLKPHLTHRHSWLHWMPAFLGLFIGVSVGIYFTKDAAENRQKINQYYADPTQAKKSATSTDTNGWMYYTNNEYSYSIKYPKDWNSIGSSQSHSLAPLPYNSRFIMDNDEFQTILFEEASDSYNGNFQITILKNINKLTLDKWAEQYHVPLAADPTTSLADFVQDTIISGVPAKEFSVFDFDHTKTRIFAITNNFIYQFDFDKSNPNDANFSKHSIIYKAMLDSFKFTDQTTSRPITQTVESPNPEGKFCGGIAANLPQNQCPQGYDCKLDGDYPDAGGICVKSY